jgi:hypothetical protein
MPMMVKIGGIAADKPDDERHCRIAEHLTDDLGDQVANVFSTREKYARLRSRTVGLPSSRSIVRCVITGRVCRSRARLRSRAVRSLSAAGPYSRKLCGAIRLQRMPARMKLCTNCR